MRVGVDPTQTGVLKHASPRGALQCWDEAALEKTCG